MKYKKRELTEEEKNKIEELRKQAEKIFSKYNETNNPKDGDEYCEIMGKIREIRYESEG